MPPHELPGFIFDEDRGRYFPVTSTNQTPPAIRYSHENIKKRKTDRRKRTELESIEKERSVLYRQYWSQLFDPYSKAFGTKKAFHFIGGIEKERYGYDKIDHFGDRLIQLDFKDSRILSYDYHDNITSLLVVTKDMLLKLPLIRNESEPFTLLRIYNTRNLEGRTTDSSYPQRAVIKKIDFDKDVGEAFVHIKLSETNIHHFGIEQLGYQQNTPYWCRIEFHPHENIHDCVNIGRNFIIAFNNKIAIVPWNVSSARITKILDKKNKSDILSLAVGDSHSDSKFLYAGCRDGSIYAIPFCEGINNELDFQSMRKVKFHHIKLIISIKPFKDHGIISVSGIRDGNSQALFLVDFLLSPSQIVIELRSSFCNLTRDKEIFEITPDGHYICYGTRNGEHNFEVFSTRIDDNLVVKSSNPVVYYPLFSKSSEFPIEMQHACIRSAGFSYYADKMTQKPQTRLFTSVEMERRDNRISSTILSIGL